MATYNFAAVADAVIAFKKGITLQQGRALRDNPLAMFEGAAGAPRLEPNAHPDFVAGGVVIDRVTVPNIVTTVTGPATGIAHNFTVMKDCTLRFFIEWRRVSGGTPITLDILRNGTSTASTSSTSGAFVGASLDVACVAGENIALLLAPTSTNVLEYRNVQVRGNMRGTYRV